MSHYADHEQVQNLLHQLLALREDMLRSQAAREFELQSIHENYQQSAPNLLHYLALRRHELRPLQHSLASLGLSSLGRAESHVLATIQTVVDVLSALESGKPVTAQARDAAVDFETGQELLTAHTETLLGATPSNRSVRIMVTMPSEAAVDYELVHQLLEQGMNCMRINCAHDDAGAWQNMIANLRRAEGALNQSCAVIMDLGGPKIRTGRLEPGPAVLRIRPQRNIYGEVVAPCRLWMGETTKPAPASATTRACLQVPTDWLHRLQANDTVEFIDARGSRRTLQIVEKTEAGCWAESGKTAYLVPGTELIHKRGSGDGPEHKVDLAYVPPQEPAILLKVGDLLFLSRGDVLGRNATFDSHGTLLTPAVISCSIPEVLDHVREGESVWFDDGKMGGVIESIADSGINIRITLAKPWGGKLRADKGINLPESKLTLSAMTHKDLDDLAFVAKHADVVELSFANCVLDVETLSLHLAEQGNHQPAVVLKVETKRGFENLPDMLLAAMKFPSCGVMIARGDLAVEVGFERLAEVQEEILWICEAAHVPVIWATQVLENLAKTGMPSRAEITDAAMGERAECIMLNKGPHIVAAVKALDDILERMQAHQTKKQAMLRELKLAHKLTH